MPATSPARSASPRPALIHFLSAVFVAATLSACLTPTRITVVTPIPAGALPTRPAPAPTATLPPVPAPTFTLTTLSGDSIALTDLQGRWVLINFWATWCLPCRTEMPDLQALADRYPNQLTILAINQREPRAIVESFVAELGLTFPILIDPDDATLVNYQVVNLPQSILIDPHGNMVYRQFGPINLTEVETRLTADTPAGHQPLQLRINLALSTSISHQPMVIFAKLV